MTLAIYGTGGHAKSIFDIVKKKKTLFFDQKENTFFKVNKKIFKIIGDHKQMENFKKKISSVIVAIGNNKTREYYFNFFKRKKFKFAKLIHPKSYTSIGVRVGEGSIIMQGCMINTETVIGKNCIINTNASIDHDCLIRDHSHICPGVTVAGNVKIGKNCWIGLGSKIIENCVIGDNVFVAAGAVVTKNVKSNSFVKGIPAKHERKKLAKL